jgi:hypothetical protein
VKAKRGGKRADGERERMRKRADSERGRKRKGEGRGRGCWVSSGCKVIHQLSRRLPIIKEKIFRDGWKSKTLQIVGIWPN